MCYHAYYVDDSRIVEAGRCCRTRWAGGASWPARGRYPLGSHWSAVHGRKHLPEQSGTRGSARCGVYTLLPAHVPIGMPCCRTSSSEPQSQEPSASKLPSWAIAERAAVNASMPHPGYRNVLFCVLVLQFLISVVAMRPFVPIAPRATWRLGNDGKSISSWRPQVIRRLQTRRACRRASKHG